MAPKRKITDLESKIAKATEEFADNIRRLVTDELAVRVGEVEDKLARVQEALNVGPKLKRKAAGRKSKKAAAKGSRRKRADVEDVKRAALGSLKAAGSAVKMSFLVESTGFSAAQLRRALAELIAGGTVVKEGEKRATTYSLAVSGNRSREKATKTARKKPSRRTSKKTTAKKKSPSRAAAAGKK